MNNDPLDYPEDRDQSGEYLRLILPMLSKFQLAANPVNFTLCYEYVSGRNQALRDVMKNILEEKRALDAKTAKELYRNYIWDADRLVLENQSIEMRRLMSETLTGVEESANKANQSSEKLELNSQKLGSLDEMQAMRSVVTDVVMETRTMAQNSHLLKDMLMETKQEVENLREELEHSRHQATTDALTSLMNRRAFDEEINKFADDANMTHESLSLLMLDIDHFKKVNDTYGHMIGDKILRFIGSQLTKNVKGQDIVARIGGEEFAILLPSTSLDQARIVGEKIRSRIESSRLKRMDDDKPLGTVTISVGTTSYKPGEAVENFLDRADQALYQSKNGGRNRVSMLL